MDKQKQIEEIARGICGLTNHCNKCFIGSNEHCGFKMVARKVLDLGYRKIPENAVVILEEEMEQFAETFAKSPQMQKVMYGLIKAWKKETAEEISNEIEDILQVPYKGNTDKQMLIRKGMTEGLKMALEICKEIVEGK